MGDQDHEDEDVQQLRDFIFAGYIEHLRPIPDIISQLDPNTDVKLRII